MKVGVRVDMEIEIANINKKIKTEKRYKIDSFRFDQEVGGVLWVHRDTFELRRVIELKNVHGDPNNYYAWSKWNLLWTLLFKIGLFQLYKDLSEGFMVGGEWHSQPKRPDSFSNVDRMIFQKRVEQYGFWLAGLMVPKTANRCVLKLNLYKKSQTIYREQPHLN